MNIRYTFIETPLGWLGMAATERGIRVMQFGDSPEALLASLPEDLPGDQLVRDDAGLAEWAAALRAYFSGGPAGAQALDSLPLDVLGTPFQQKVWAELRKIPYGETRTYTQLALASGYAPNAARAAGRACATNPVALIIPCHRMRHVDGGLAGYRYGLHRKRALHDLERGLSYNTRLSET